RRARAARARAGGAVDVGRRLRTPCRARQRRGRRRPSRGESAHPAAAVRRRPRDQRRRPGCAATAVVPARDARDRALPGANAAGGAAAAHGTPRGGPAVSTRRVLPAVVLVAVLGVAAYAAWPHNAAPAPYAGFV